MNDASSKPTLPGPASLVEQVWTDTEIGEFFSAAGFVGLRFTKLSQKPCFTVGKAQLRETKLSGSKPGTAGPSLTVWNTSNSGSTSP